jgi:homocysteine S-methyltransferase
MSLFRTDLPQLGNQIFMTDGGLETTLIFHDHIDLPCFAAFDLLKNDAGTAVLERYYARYAALARDEDVGLVLETPTWRANPDWGRQLGYDAAALAVANRKAVDLLLRIRAAWQTPATPIVISGNLGPRGDGYRVDTRMSAADAAAYHRPQLDTFAASDADMAAAVTMNYVDEALGIVHAAQACGLPVAISFTVETDGRLPSGDTLEDAIARTDRESDGYPVYYMINCAHPTHFAATLRQGGSWLQRIHGVRANASRLSHAELDEATELDAGNPAELGMQYGALRRFLRQMNVVGGCCGTDHRHVEQMCRAMKISVADQPTQAAGYRA